MTTHQTEIDFLNHLPVKGTCPACKGKGKVMSVSFTVVDCPRCWGTAYQGLSDQQALWVVNVRKEIDYVLSMEKKNENTVLSIESKNTPDGLRRRLQYQLGLSRRELHQQKQSIRNRITAALAKLGLLEQARKDQRDCMGSLELICRSAVPVVQAVADKPKTRKSKKQLVSVPVPTTLTELVETK